MVVDERRGRYGVVDRGELQSGIVVSSDVDMGLPVLKSWCFCGSGRGSGCQGVVGHVEKVGPAKEIMSSSWSPKNPDNSR